MQGLLQELLKEQGLLYFKNKKKSIIFSLISNQKFKKITLIEVLIAFFFGIFFSHFKSLWGDVLSIVDSEGEGAPLLQLNICQGFGMSQKVLQGSKGDSNTLLQFHWLVSQPRCHLLEKGLDLGETRSRSCGLPDGHEEHTKFSDNLT